MRSEKKVRPIRRAPAFGDQPLGFTELRRRRRVARSRVSGRSGTVPAPLHSRQNRSPLPPHWEHSTPPRRPRPSHTGQVSFPAPLHLGHTISFLLNGFVGFRQALERGIP